MGRQAQNKEAGALVFLVEELGDARLLCDKLLRYVERATALVEQSTHKDHIFEVAGDILQGIPETASKLQEALHAVTMATNRMDYEDVKQSLPPKKVDELEAVLDDVRIRPVRRRGNLMTPQEAVQELRSLFAATQEEGRLPVVAALDLIAALEAGGKTASQVTAADHLASFIEVLENPPANSQGPSRQKLAAALRSLVAQELSVADLKAIQKALEDILIEAKKEKLTHIEDDAKKALKKLKLASNSTALDIEKQAYEMSKQDWQQALKNDEAMLKIYERDLQKLQDGKEVKYLTLEGAKQSIESMKAVIRNKKDLISKMASDEDATEKEARFEKGKPADPTQNMSDADAAEWKAQNEEHRDKFKTAASGKTIDDDADTMTGPIVRALKSALKAGQDATGVTKDEAKSEISDSVSELREILKGLERNSSNALPKLQDAAIHLWQIAYYSGAAKSAKTASADSSEWKVQAEDQDEDEKTASVNLKLPFKPSQFARGIESEDFQKGLNLVADDLFSLRTYVRQIGDTLKDCEEAYIAGDGPYAGNDIVAKRSPEVRKETYLLDQQIGTVANNFELIARLLKSAKKTASDEEEKLSRFEEGKPADPTKNMTPADAKEWKDNTEEHKDDFKKSAANMSENSWYIQEFRDIGPIYFYAQEKLKNGGYKGLMVPTSDAGNPMKAKKSPVHPMDARLWTAIKESDVPSKVKSRVNERTASEEVSWKVAFEVEAAALKWKETFPGTYDAKVDTQDGAYVFNLRPFKGPGVDLYRLTVLFPDKRTLLKYNRQLPDIKKLKDVASAFAKTLQADHGGVDFSKEWGKMAAESDVESRYEEGKPADPTENMSPADAKEWKDNTDKYEDEFKKSASGTVEIPLHYDNVKNVGKKVYSSGRVEYWYTLKSGAKMAYTDAQKFRYQLRNQANVPEADKLMKQLDDKVPSPKTASADPWKA